MYETNSPFIAQILPLNESRVFTLSEARALMPLVMKITNAAHKKLEPLRSQLQSTIATGDVSAESIELAYRKVVQNWIDKLQRLGVIASDLWVVHFDTGDGHLYEDCEHGRRSIDEYIELFQPDWG